MRLLTQVEQTECAGSSWDFDGTFRPGADGWMFLIVSALMIYTVCKDYTMEKESERA